VLVADRKRLQRIAGVHLEVPTLEIETDVAGLLKDAGVAELPPAEIDEDDPAVICSLAARPAGPKAPSTRIAASAASYRPHISTACAP
jgi:hypothetical protein